MTADVHWRQVPLFEVCRPRQWPTIAKSKLSGEGFPVYGANGIIGFHGEYNHAEPTILVGCRGTCGNVMLSEPKSYINGNAMCLDDFRSDVLDRRFALLALKAVDWTDVITGTAQPQITRKTLERVNLPCPPMEMQQRIVEKVDALFAHSRKAKESLDRVPALLEKLKKSILTAAFRGDLTKDWREANPNVEPADQLLARIRTERRRRWEEAELTKLRAKGKEPKNDRWKSKYKASPSADTDTLCRLPDGWTWATIGEVGETSTGSTPPTKQPEFFGDAVPFFKPTDLDAGYRTTEARSSLSNLGAERNGVVQAGAVLVTCIGATIGKTGLLRRGGSFNQQINAVVPASQLVTPEWLFWMLCGPWGQDQVISNSSSTTLPILNRGRFDKIPIPVPPVAEQHAAIRVVEQSVSLATRQADTAESSARRLARLEASILGEAFRGELVEHSLPHVTAPRQPTESVP